MYANTQLQLAHVENSLTIPVEGLVLAGKQQVVYVVDGDNHVHQRAVTVGIEGSKLAEIKSGLRAGEHVIMGGQEKYHEGELVHPAVAPTPASETNSASNSIVDMSNGEGGAQ